MSVKKFFVFLSEPTFTPYLLVPFADNFSKQIGPKLFDTLIVFLKEFFGKRDFEKKSADDQKPGKIGGGGGVLRVKVTIQMMWSQISQLLQELD